MVLPLIMMTKINFKKEKNAKIYYFVTFKELQEKSVFLKISAQTYETGDF